MSLLTRAEAADFLVIDHVVPVAKGGTDDPDNLAVACAGKRDG